MRLLLKSSLCSPESHIHTQLHFSPSALNNIQYRVDYRPHEMPTEQAASGWGKRSGLQQLEYAAAATAATAAAASQHCCPNTALHLGPQFDVVAG
jgi:hypothetical protein